MAVNQGNKAKFGKIGLIAATVGSAVGLGNIWRFPAEVQANGGGAFLLVYIACVFLLGIPVMLADFAIGRGQQSDSVGAFRKMAPGKQWWITGVLAVMASFFILAFYMVVAGWTADYLWESVTGALYAPVGPGDTMDTASQLDKHFGLMETAYIGTDFHAIVSTIIVIILNFGILVFGIKKGVEKASLVMMPILFLLLLVFMCVSLSLDKAVEGLEFFFRPDFSAITPRVVINALGQAFFSLSLGMGILITYSGYYPRNANLTQTAVTVSMLDMLVAVMMGVIICPVILTFGFTPDKISGATLVFITLPEVFAQMPGTQIWSVLFFLLLFVAALTSTISVSEVVIAFIQQQFKAKRLTACLAVMIVLTPFCLLCAMSQGSMSGFTIAGLTVFDLLDNITTTFFLPVVALLTCVFLGWFVPKSYLRDELTNDGLIKAPVGAIHLCVKYLCPILILIVLIAGLL